MACTAHAGSWPRATTPPAAMAALARLHHPGSWRLTGRRWPSSRTRSRPSSHSSGLGRRREHDEHAQSAAWPSSAVGPPDAVAAGGTGGRVLPPPLAGADPDLGGGRVGRPHHQGVVDVGHHRRRRLGVEHLPPREGVEADLADAVELVAAEVEQHHHVGRHRRRRVRQQPLVDLERHHRPRPLVGQGAHQPRQEVGPGGVGLHRPPRGQRRRQQPGGGGLAVGAGDERHLVAGGHLLQGRRVDGQRHPPPDDGARTPSGTAGNLRHHPAGEGRGSGP